MPVAPPRPKSPPLNALRAFEAAARLGGFKAAASELCVTPAAIAQHIKSLEETLGAPLFERRSQGVRLTTLGRSAAPAFSGAFDQLGEACALLRRRAEPNTVRIAALPSVAQLWLSPRLAELRQAAAGAAISITALETPPNLKREPFDIALFFEEPPFTAGSTALAQDVLYPVCAPSLAETLHSPADLAKAVLLHDASWSEDWARWLSPEAEALTPTRGASYSLYALAVEEAKRGAGVLIGHEPLVAPLVRCGDLVAPFKRKLRLKRALTLRVASQDNTIDAVAQVAQALRAAA